MRPPCVCYICSELAQYHLTAIKANNFKQYQYDTGVYYHVTKDDVWPLGIEYQPCSNHSLLIKQPKRNQL